MRYIQYFATNDFSGAGLRGVPSRSSHSTDAGASLRSEEGHGSRSSWIVSVSVSDKDDEDDEAGSRNESMSSVLSHA